jgi:hypothetical protein
MTSKKAGEGKKDNQRMFKGKKEKERAGFQTIFFFCSSLGCFYSNAAFVRRHDVSKS